MTVKNFQSLKNLIHFSSMISSFAFLNLITFFFCIQFYHLKKLCFMYIFFPPPHIHVYFFSSTFISFYTFMCYAHKLIITKGRVDSKQLLSGSKSFFLHLRMRVQKHTICSTFMYENHETFMTEILL